MYDDALHDICRRNLDIEHKTYAQIISSSTAPLRIDGEMYDVRLHDVSSRVCEMLAGASDNLVMVWGCNVPPVPRSLVPTKHHRYDTPFQSIMKRVVNIVPKSKDLIVFMRRWAKDRGICRTAMGGMSSYAWTLLCISAELMCEPESLAGQCSATGFR